MIEKWVLELCKRVWLTLYQTDLNKTKRNMEKWKWNPQEEKDGLRLYQTL